MDPYILLADTLSGLAAALPQQHAALLASCAGDAATQTALQGVLAHADTVRQQKAAEQAAKAAGGSA